MASDEVFRIRLPSSPVTAAGIDHVWLSYRYLDLGDIDGYLSLLDAGMSIHRPGQQEIRCREQIGVFQAQPEQRAGEHVIHDVFGGGGWVIAEGCYLSRRSGEGVDFIEVFQLSEEGLLRSQKRYYFIELSLPASHSPR
jgi:hypothetical protein